MDGEAGQPASSLPYGKQRKLEIARALATNPKLLLLDEPAAGMNPNETAELMETVRFVRDKFDIAVLLIEHDMSFVMGLCEHITVLDYGRIIAEATPRPSAATQRLLRHIWEVRRNGVMLSVKDLVVNYGAINAIKGISFDVNEGRDRHADRRKRCGKTTTLHAVSRLLKPKQGEIPFAASPSAAWKRIKSSSWA